MDKREYQEKLQEINRLIAEEDYEGAAKIADSIDWKRVRNVQTLVMISEVYEALERYEDSKVLLLRAYRRTPTGRTVLYRLVECCIKLRQFDQAIEYYSEYVQAAPHDNNKYILKYKIYRGRGSSLDEQIDILKEYLDQEYNEKWAYELARLQVQADRVQEGIATCDDLVLWFHSGKYVIKALELKKKYAPLTPKQQEIYDNRFDEEEEESELRPESYLSEAASLAKAERAAVAQEEIKSELAADISHTAQIEATKAELSRRAEEVQAEVDRKAAESMKALAEKPETEPAEAGSFEAAKAVKEVIPGFVPSSGVMSAKSADPEQAAIAEEAGAAKSPETAEAPLAGIPEAAAETAAGIVETVAEPLAGIPEAAAETLAGIAETVEEPLAGIPEAVAETAAGIAETVEEPLAGIPEAAAEPLAGIPEAAEETAWSALKNAVSGAQAPASEDSGDALPEMTIPAFTVAEPAEKAEPAVSGAAWPEAAEEDLSVPEPLFGQSAEKDEDAGAFSGEDAGEPEAVPGEAAEEISSQQMQEDMIRSMREIVSGVGPKEQIEADEAALEEAIEQSKEDQENAVAARGTDMTFRVPASEASVKRQAGRLTIDDILLAMGDKGSHLREVTGGSVMSATEEAEMTAQNQAEAKAASYDGTVPASTAESDRQPEEGESAGEEFEEDVLGSVSGSEREEAPEIPQIPRFLRNDVREARNTSEIPATDIARADDALRAGMAFESGAGSAGQDGKPAGMDLPEAFGPAFSQDEPGGAQAEETGESGAVPGGVNPAETPVSGGMAAGEESGAPTTEEDEALETDTAAAVAAAFINTPRVAYTKEIAEAKTRRLPVDEIRKLHEAYLSESAAAAEEAAKNAAQAAEKAAEMAEVEVSVRTDEVYAEDDVKIAARPGSSSRDEAGSFPSSDDRQPDGVQTRPRTGGAVDESFSVSGAAAAVAAGGAAGGSVAGRIGEQVTREVPKSEPEPQIFTGRQQLKENQMELFRGFTSIGTLPEQIAGAIWQAENRKDDRTSRTGNILILGAHGCGKTTIATGIAKAIAEDKGTHSVKMAKIYAADLNRKDIAATIAKIAGGVLIVEEAGDLDDAIVDQLTTAMEFRTDGLIMILEDEQRYIHDLLMRHPRFTMKFTAQIYIPEYSGEDLVNFGQIYANSKDYVLSEKAVEACRERVDAAKKSGEAVSVTNVIELVDRAIRNANTFFRRIGSAKKRYDSEDRIILREKDFR